MLFFVVYTHVGPEANLGLVLQVLITCFFSFLDKDSQSLAGLDLTIGWAG